jgi:hypothetical protein
LGEQRKTKRPHIGNNSINIAQTLDTLDKKPSKSIKKFPSTNHIMNSHQKHTSSKAITYFIWFYTSKVKVIVLN